jgi:hypothetical protein
MAMTRYLNVSGKSNVVAFDISGFDRILVEFGDGSTYEYTEQSAGVGNIATMKQLAMSGYGLNSFCNRRVRKLYARKF